MRHLLTLALAVTLAAAPAMALGPVAFGPSLTGAGWKALTFRGKPAVDYSAEGAGTLHIRSDTAVSVIWRTLPRDFADGASAAWRWKVDAGVPPTDLGRRGDDDRAIARYFLFADDPAAADNPPTSLSGAMLRGRALIYVWGGDAATGSIISGPRMFGRGQLVIQRPAVTPTGSWQAESVDLRADFRRAFDREPGPLVGLGVSSDSDGTGSVTEATIADLVIR
jgi:hypothetical protein